MLDVKIKKLTEQAVIPTYAKNGDAGLDLTAISVSTVDMGSYGYIEYGTGLAMEIPKGYEGEIRPRSSISNTGLILANSPGTIDSNYRGEIKIRFKAIPGTNIYNVGDRIAQILIKPLPEINFVVVDELSSTDRGLDGFGSTGK